MCRACSLLKLAFDPKSVKFVKWVYEKLTCLAHCSILPTKTFETQPILPLWWGGQVNSRGSHVTKHEQAEREGHSFNHVGESNG
ncbi:hypothetical protein Prudu_004286 [Prunus dulcis]|uniref:Uncharacterized protein n=1 Tax=Prunus dulcis TaxID=3755 RepID=A0A4Y1QUY0_PRUDU|nr:hypothetical protein Prudu_004286 [Prunus dulcis]